MGFLNVPEVTERSYLCESTILTLSHLNYLNFQDSFVSPKLKNEISEISIMEKLVFLVLSFYVVATEHRFLEHQEKSNNPYYRILLNFLESKTEDKSEIFLSTGVEVAYQFTSENFPVINQIFSVFKKFELNLGKVICESHEEGQRYKFLLPLKNGFRNNSIIPMFKEGRKVKFPRPVDEDKESHSDDGVQNKENISPPNACFSAMERQGDKKGEKRPLRMSQKEKSKKKTKSKQK